MSDPNPEPRPVATTEPGGTPNHREVGSGIPIPPGDEGAAGRPSFAALFFEDLLRANLATRIVGVSCVVVIVACVFYVGGGMMEEEKLRESDQQEEDVTPVTVELPPGVTFPLQTGSPQASELKREIRLLEDQLDLDNVNSLLISPAFSKLPESASIEELLERREALRSLREFSLSSPPVPAVNHSGKSARQQARERAMKRIEALTKGGESASPPTSGEPSEPDANPDAAIEN